MWKLLRVLLISVLILCSYYSFSFAAWPSGPNTKMILAALGLVWFLFDSWRQGRGLPFTPLMTGGAIFAGVYSIINLVSVEINATNDYSYANYLTTFFVWVFSIYPAMAMLRLEYGQVTFTRVTYYLAGVSVFQCISALLIDNIPEVERWVTSIVYYNAEFVERIDRLRCFSTFLDAAGVRFALVLILIAGCLGSDQELRQRSENIIYLLLSFFIILGIGSMVSRTTFIGAATGIVIYIVQSFLGPVKGESSPSKIVPIFTSIAVLIIGGSIYLYSTDPYYYELIRFAFEGFFNLVEKGEFTTSSTEVLKTMWQWPKDPQSWIIGTGAYGSFLFGTDIGYCRLILYSGLTGFVTFALSFVFYAYMLGTRYRPYRWMFIALCAMTFIIWVKVSTDILMIYAFMFWLRPEDDTLIFKQAQS
jgi:tonB box